MSLRKVLCAFSVYGPSPWGDTGTAVVRWVSVSDPGLVHFPLPLFSSLPLVLSPFGPPSLSPNISLGLFSAYLGAQQVKQQRFRDGVQEWKRRSAYRKRAGETLPEPGLQERKENDFRDGNCFNKNLQSSRIRKTIRSFCGIPPPQT